ncbi:glycine cleavage system aminomethyltransferase GcvT [Halorarius litoreus]|uniref:glycine cleavage system aminomethyltransferase GcvT n=1 Tax=Halorarius litoreus TaxID=2962676 RepID=UPI0020CB96FC|nr:glycine cleavage system aminomethyltransferase GcvT [Halorarius litoreus]
MAHRESPLAAAHDALGARMTEFGGWDMPVQFESIKTEHAAVREHAGVFDVSHMGEVVVTGPDAGELLNSLTTNDVSALDPGDVQYACICRGDGAIVDDTVVYHRPEGGYMFVPNAGQGGEMAGNFRAFAESRDLTATVENRTDDLGMLAVQGPEAEQHVDAATADSVADAGRFTARRTTIDGVDCLVSRTGYTGEDGFEIVFPADEAMPVWTAFDDLQPCGLGARDTLRLEAGLLLSGQDFHPVREPRTPYEADLGFVVALDTEFVGRDALAEQHETGVDEQLVGVELDERGVPRHDCPILVDGEEVGHVTSGTMSPTLDIPIGVGYVDAAYAEAGTDAAVEIRGTAKEATITSQRFLQRHRNN